MDNQNKIKYVCQWSLEIIYGKQSEALSVMRKWGEEKFKTSAFKLSESRMMNGYIGESPSLIIDEYIFESMNDFENALSDMAQPQFKQFSEALAPLIVAGTQKWKVFKICS